MQRSTIHKIGKSVKCLGWTMMHLLLFCVIQSASGQDNPDIFNFNYNGPDTIFVDDNCIGELEWGHPDNPTCTVSGPGAVLISFDLWSISDGYEMGDFVASGEEVVVIYRALDNMGGQAFFGFTIAFSDNTPPVFDPLSLPPDMTVNCGDTVPMFFPQATDNCDFLGLAITYSRIADLPALSCADTSVEVLWMATDSSGNTAVHVQHVTVAGDSSAPVFTSLPADITVDCNDMPQAYFDWLNGQVALVEAVDDGCGFVQFGYTAPDTSQVIDSCGTLTATFQAIDTCGNIANASASFTIIDSTAPVIIAEAQNLAVDCSDPSAGQQLNDWFLDQGGAEATDNCGSISWFTYPPDPLALLDCATNFDVYFIAMDACGQSDTSVASLSLVDTIPPDIVIPPADSILSCTTAFPDSIFIHWILDIGGAEIADYCSPQEDLSIHLLIGGDTLTINEAVQILNDQLLLGCQDSVFHEGIYYDDVLAKVDAVFLLTDYCGNAVADSATFIILDNGRPQLIQNAMDTAYSCDSPTSLEASFRLWMNNFGGASFTDSCGAVSYHSIPDTAQAWSLFVSGLDTACVGMYAFNMGFYASDACGKLSADTTYASFMFIDTTSPQIIVPADSIVLNCSDQTQDSLVNWIDNKGGSSATDNCSVEIGGYFFWKNIAGDTIIGNYSVGPYPQLSDSDCASALQIWFVHNDECGNLAVSIGQFAIIDNLPPVFADFQDTLLVDCSLIAELDSIPVTDDCSTVSLNFQDSIVLPSSDTTDCLSHTNIIFRNWIATDACGNADSVTQLILTEDRTGPLFQAPPDVILECTLIDSLDFSGEPTMIMDPCGGPVTVDFVDSIASQNCNYSVFRTWLLSDICGNTSSAIQVISVRDTSPPIWETTPQDIGVSCDDIIATAFDNWLDSIGGAALSESCSFYQWFAAMPGSYNISDSSTFPGTLPVLPDTSLCGEIIVLVDFVAYDSCYNVTVEQAVFSVIDTILPTIVEIGLDETYILPADSCAISLVLRAPQVADNCAIDSIGYAVIVDESDTTFLMYSADDSLTLDFNIGTHTLKYLIDDCKGNTLADEITIQIQDTIAPQITCLSLFDTILAPDSCSLVLTVLPPFDILDNCNTPDSLAVFFMISGATTLAQQAYESIDIRFNSGESIVRYIVTDASDNEGICETRIFVRDTLAPRAICSNIVYQLHPGGLGPQSIDPILVDGGSFDNCGIVDRVLSPAVVDCDSIGSEFEAVLYVYDRSGNVDSCTSNIRVVNYDLDISYLLDVCNPDTLMLFSNAPDADDISYTYNWQGPAAFNSTDRDPILNNVTSLNSGQYNVTVSGFNGCFATGSIQINILDNAIPVIEAVTPIVCEGDPIRLTSTVFPGQVTYRWYQGLFPNGIEIGSTQNPSFTTTLPIGDYLFYVIIENQECESNASLEVVVSVVEQPLASIDPPLQVICLGETIQLSTDIDGSSFTYLWQGPAGFISTQRIPPPITNALHVNEGIYTLQVFLGSCESNIAMAEVIINDPPDKPFVPAPDPICVGLDLNMTINNVLDAERYLWIHPNGSIITTFVNTITLDDIDPSSAGAWTVKAIKNGCTSAAADSVMVIVDLPPVVEARLIGNVACTGDSMTLTVDSLDGATYMWSGPASFSSNERTIRLPATPGLFSVEITTASLCNATSSVDVVLTDPPTILSVTNDGLDCVDGTTDICFKIVTDPVDNGNFTYYWEGPNGFQSDLAEPCLLNVTDTVNGVYTLEVESNGCISNLVTSLVEVTNISERPSISGIDTYCEGSTLILSTTEFGGIGSEYFWITPNGQISTADSFLLLPDIDTMDGGAYAVYLVNEGCTTLVSDPLDIEVIPLPYLPEIFGETDYCEGDSIILYTSEQEDATFNWKGPQNFTASGQEIVVFPASSSNSGLYFIDAQRGECQTETQGSVLVEVTDIPPAPMILEFPDSICLDYQQTIELCVDPNSAVAGGSYLFLLVDPDTAISDTSRSLCQIIDISTDLFTEGRQSIFAKTIVNGCPSSSAIPTLVPMFEVPEEEANAGDDVILCDELDGQLNARDPIVGSGKWLFDVDDLFINRIHDSGSSFSLEDEQSAQAIWSLDYAACKDYDRDTTSALFIPYPEAFDDLVTTDIGRSVDFDFLFNDQYRDSVIISLINLGSKGDADLNDDQSLHYEPAPTSSGEEIINYEICDVNCPDLCSVAQIRILIGDGEDCTVPTIITPNDDGYNDYFIIPCLGNSLYDDNEVIIINQWGDEMFRQTSYKNDWQGTYNGDPVAEGTYFFLVKFGDKRPPQSGFIHIERD